MRMTLWTAALLLGAGLLWSAGSATKSLANPSTAAVTPTATAGQTSPTAMHKEANVPADLNAQIEMWRKTLAQQSDFQAWSNASWTSYPLGPGTHGYLVQLVADGKEVGYMIVTADMDGTFKLTEYGTGSNPLYSLSTLYRSLVQQELIPSSMKLDQFLNDSSIKQERLYASPVHALWKVTVNGKTIYLDAKTGEKLPVDETMLPHDAQAPSASVSGSAQISDQLLLPSFDPYERISWLTEPALKVREFTDVKEALVAKERLIFVAEPYGESITIPLPVIGYQIWNAGSSNGAYLALDQDGTRYASFQAISRFGRFYP